MVTCRVAVGSCLVFGGVVMMASVFGCVAFPWRVLYWDYEGLPGYWTIRDTLNFTFWVWDTSQKGDLYVYVRISEDFPTQNLWVAMEVTLPDGRQEWRKLNLELFSRHGKPYGAGGWRARMDIAVPIGEVRFPVVGRYRWRFWHIMRMDTVPGIFELGVLLRVPYGGVPRSGYALQK